MKTVFQQVAALLDTANAALGELDWHIDFPPTSHPNLSKVTKAMMITKLERTDEIVSRLKEKASK